MEGFRQWAGAVCTAAVVCSLLQLLFPDSSLGRQGRLALPCVFLCVLLSPLSGGLKSVKLPDFTSEESLDSGDLEVRMQQQTIMQVNETLRRMLNQSFGKFGWEVRKVVTDMDISADKGIHMGQITIYVDEEVARRTSQVRQVAQQRLGMPVTVAIWEETS